MILHTLVNIKFAGEYKCSLFHFFASVGLF